MKTTNKIGIVFFGSIMALMIVLPLIGDFVPTQPDPVPEDPSEIVYSAKTQQLEALYTIAVSDKDAKKQTMDISKIAYDNSVMEYEVAEKSTCMSLYLYAQSKWSDTPDYFENEKSRIEESMKSAQECAGF